MACTTAHSGLFGEACTGSLFQYCCYGTQCQDNCFVSRQEDSSLQSTLASLLFLGLLCHYCHPLVPNDEPLDLPGSDECDAEVAVIKIRVELERGHKRRQVGHVGVDLQCRLYERCVIANIWLKYGLPTPLWHAITGIGILVRLPNMVQAACYAWQIGPTVSYSFQ
jgi:hypothetical protein